MSIISKETFEKFTEDEKQNVRSHYEAFDEPMLIRSYADLFGKENLQPEPKIKTWADVAVHKTELRDFINKLSKKIANCPYIDSKWYKKLMATVQIQKLIELGYGGMITEREWKLSASYMPENRIWAIVCQYKNGSIETEIKIIPVWAQPRLLSFHTKQQAENFMSYPENRTLVEHYHMI